MSIGELLTGIIACIFILRIVCRYRKNETKGSFFHIAAIIIEGALLIISFVTKNHVTQYVFYIALVGHTVVILAIELRARKTNK